MKILPRTTNWTNWRDEEEPPPPPPRSDPDLWINTSYQHTQTGTKIIPPVLTVCLPGHVPEGARCCHMTSDLSHTHTEVTGGELGCVSVTQITFTGQEQEAASRRETPSRRRWRREAGPKQTQGAVTSRWPPFLHTTETISKPVQPS